MKTSFIALILVAVGSAVACRSVLFAEGETPDPTNAASIDATALGGIAALRIVYHVDSATGAATYQMGPLCDAVTNCPTNVSLAGQVDRATIDELYARAASPAFRALRADYGTTRNAADMQTHVLTIRTNGRVRSIQADDGTMPTLMAQFNNDVVSAVSKVVK
jgi:hypothetical protein